MSEFWTKFAVLLCILPVAIMIGCSRIDILRPNNGNQYKAGEVIPFEGEVTTWLETGGEDRSNELSWESSLDGHLADGRSFATNALSPGNHVIIVTWPGHDQRKNIAIQVR